LHDDEDDGAATLTAFARSTGQPSGPSGEPGEPAASTRMHLAAFDNALTPVDQNISIAYAHRI
jgi:hypothetical protein